MINALAASLLPVFFFEAHDGLEEVVIKPELIVELVRQMGVSDSIQTVITKVGSDLAKVVFFNKAIIIFDVGTAATDVQGADPFTPTAQQNLIDEFGAVIWMNFQDREGQALFETLEAILDHQIGTSQE